MGGWAAACGSSTELVIGGNYGAGAGGTPDLSGAGGLLPTAGMSEGGSAAAPADGGSETGGVSGAAGSHGDAGSACMGDAGAQAVPAPVHRYSFDGAGGAVADSVGGAPGALVNGGTFDGKGTLTLDGSTGYVDFPNHLINTFNDVTFMVWTSWPKGGAGFTRIFDFGTSTVGENPSGDSRGLNYIMASPFTGWAAGGNLGVEIGTPGTGIVQVPSSESLKNPIMHQVTVVFRSLQQVDLYLDSILLNSAAIPKGKLTEIDDVNNWLGRSQTFSDNRYSGSYTEFRIYDRALDACAIQSALNAGPDAL